MRRLSTTVRTVWHQHGSSLIFASLSSAFVVVAANGATTPTTPTTTTTTTSSCESSSSSPSLLSRAAPTSPIYTYRPNPFLEIAFDVRTKCPVYVLEQLLPDQWVSSARNDGRRRRRPNFHEEKTLPEHFRSRSSHTRQQSNWDRGHMAPAGDFSYEDGLLTDTFCLTNTAPQDAALNRGAWAALEEWTRQVAVRAWKEHSSTKTFVLTGPLWLPTRQTDEKEFEFQYLALGTPPSLLSVPSHFFKVVIMVVEEESSSSLKDTDSATLTTTIGAACFVLPNQPVPPVSDFTQWSVPFKALEAVSGLTLFPTFLTQEQKDGLDETLPRRRHHQGESTLLLFLTDDSGTSSGSSSSSTPRKKRPNPKRSTSMARHLCEEGACRVSSKHPAIANAKNLR